VIARSWRREKGGAAIELVLVTPLLLLFVLVAVAFGRLANARLQVNDAASQAARAASIARDPGTASAAAHRTAVASLAGHRLTCQRVAVTIDTSAFHPGGAVTARITCTVALADLAPLPVPGQETVQATATSPIDVYRGGP
jgi:Flp pilus assembly protein TadG